MRIRVSLSPHNWFAERGQIGNSFFFSPRSDFVRGVFASCVLVCIVIPSFVFFKSVSTAGHLRASRSLDDAISLDPVSLSFHKTQPVSVVQYYSSWRQWTTIIFQHGRSNRERSPKVQCHRDTSELLRIVSRRR